MKKTHIAAVILNYNTEKDLKICAEQIAKQEGVNLTLILVDNASRSESFESIKKWIRDWRSDAICGTEEEIHAWTNEYPDRLSHSGNVFLMKSEKNLGYSAGNNLGIRLANKLQADAVLIANPDMRIENPSYLAALSLHLFADDSNYIAASRIIGFDGKDQNPLRDATFWEEFLWPLTAIRQRLKGNHYVQKITSSDPVYVPKVSGCCLLLRMSFLKATDYLDENVFLFCEEPILSAKVRKAGGAILYTPEITAVHAHIASQKGNSGNRMQLFIHSRLYYLQKYSGYSLWQIKALKVSYALLAWMHRNLASLRSRRNVT